MWYAKTGPGAKEINISYYAEEDFADLFSAVSLGPSYENFFCFSISRNYYQTKSLEKLFDDDPDDEHSDDFFRLLHIEKARAGDLPPACLKIINDKKVNQKFKDCFKKKLLRKGDEKQY